MPPPIKFVVLMDFVLTTYLASLKSIYLLDTCWEIGEGSFKRTLYSKCWAAMWEVMTPVPIAAPTLTLTFSARGQVSRKIIQANEDFDVRTYHISSTHRRRCCWRKSVSPRWPYVPRDEESARSLAGRSQFRGGAIGNRAYSFPSPIARSRSVAKVTSASLT